MGRREDFYKILRNEQPDCVLVDFGGNPLSSMEGSSMNRLLEYLGYDAPKQADILPFGRARRLDERILTHFDIDTRSVGGILRPAKSQYKKISDFEYLDEWGIRRKYTGMYWDAVDCPLHGATVGDLEKYAWPEPASINRNEIEEYTKQAQKLYEETDYVICAEHPVYGIFELGCWMCGFDDFLLKMAMDEEFIHKFFEIVLNYQRKVIEIYYGSLGKYIHYTSSGDDFATQASLFVSPSMFNRLVKPYFKQRITDTKNFTDAAYLHHSCGSVFPIIGELINCGVDILNPIQPKANGMQPENLKKTYGDRIVYHGGIDTQELLPFGSKEAIEDAVRKTIDVMNANGGYIFAAAHNIQEDVPPQNLAYMLESAKAYAVN